MSNRIKLITTLSILSIFITIPAYGMHIAEGFLTFSWSIFWWVFYLPFFFIGLKKLKTSADTLENKQLLALTGAFIFFLSAIKLPSITGSSSHATGIALGAILLGLGEIYVLGAAVLLFQATLLAHGGFTTLGANALSMAVVGATFSYFVYTQGKKYLKENHAIFLSAFLGNLATYSFTSLQLSLSHSNGDFFGSFAKFLSLFSITQIPLGIVEGILTVMLISFIPQSFSQKFENKGRASENFKTGEVR